MECPAQRLFQDTLCMLLADPRSPPTLIPGLVAENRDHYLPSDSLCHQTLHPHSIYNLGIVVPSRRANMSMFIAVYAMTVAMFIFYFVDMTFNIFICHTWEKYWN